MTYHFPSGTPFLASCGTDTRQSDGLLTSIKTRVDCETCRRLMAEIVRVRWSKPMRLACGLGHPMSGENLYVHPNGARRCRICTRAYERDWRRRERANK